MVLAVKEARATLGTEEVMRADARRADRANIFAKECEGS